MVVASWSLRETDMMAVEINVFSMERVTLGCKMVSSIWVIGRRAICMERAIYDSLMKTIIMVSSRMVFLTELI